MPSDQRIEVQTWEPVAQQLTFGVNRLTNAGRRPTAWILEGRLVKLDSQDFRITIHGGFDGLLNDLVTLHTDGS